MRAPDHGQQPPDLMGGTSPVPAAYTVDMSILAEFVQELESRDLRTNGPVAIGAQGAYTSIGMTDAVSALSAVLALRRPARA